MIDGVKVKILNRHVDERGYLMEILRADDKDIFRKFGQIYVTTCYPDVIKAWHRHKKQYDNFCCIRGNVKIGLYDGRKNSKTYKKTETYILGELNPVLLQIPPFVWHGQMALGNEMSYLLNIPTEPYNRKKPDEDRINPYEADFNYEWQVKNK